MPSSEPPQPPLPLAYLHPCDTLYFTVLFDLVDRLFKLCYNDLKLPFTVRNKQEGDFIKMNFGNKKVSRILIDQKVEKEKRNIIPLIFNNDGDLLWIYNYAKNADVINQKEIGDIYLVCEEVKND